MSLSKLFIPVNIFCESGLKAIVLIGIACSSRECLTFLVSISKMLIMPSIAPLARYWPSGENAIDRMNFSLKQEKNTIY